MPVLPANLQWCQPLLARLMAKDPLERFESASQVVEELEMVVDRMKGRHLGNE